MSAHRRTRPRSTRVLAFGHGTSLHILELRLPAVRMPRDRIWRIALAVAAVLGFLIILGAIVGPAPQHARGIPARPSTVTGQPISRTVGT